LKKYKEFLNEINIGYSDNSEIESYTFFISFKDSNKFDKHLIFEKLKKYLTEETESKLFYFINTISYFWKVELRNLNGNLFIDLDIKPKRGNHEKELKCDEFLSVGLEGVKYYIEKKEEEKILRKDTQRYNL